MRVRHLLAVVIFLLVVGLSAAAYASIPVPSAYVSGIDYVAGTVTIAAYHADDTDEVYLYDAGSFVSSSTCAPGRTKTLLKPYALRAVKTLTVIGRDGAGNSVWSVPVKLNPATYKPERPKISIGAGAVVPSRWSFSGTALKPVTQVRAFCPENWRTTTVRPAADNTGSFAFGRVPVPFGPASFSIVATNGFGASPKAVVKVYNLGSDLPRASRYELVCKNILWMFDISNGRVIHAWPIATGTPQTPTPSGTFRIGAARPAGGDWGVLRRPLYRVRYGHYYASGYYIHGTNAPWSIGMQASHGCIRMYNHSVRQFAAVVPNNTLVVIR